MFSKKLSKDISGWGRFPKISVIENSPSNLNQLMESLDDASSFIARGNGRSYGDSSINKNLTINMTKFNKFLSWNDSNGELVVESGVLISDIISCFLPRGWFPLVTAGTKFITVGGAIACNVHGKNHHKDGSFEKCVNWIELIVDSKKVVRCSRDENVDLFNWTIGGMGLTGVIIRCSINLKKVETGWISERRIVNHNFEETLQSFSDHNDSTYSVAWLDCLSKGKAFGRSILMIGEHASLHNIEKKVCFPKKRSKKLSMFFDAPSFLLNNITVSLFNEFYFNVNKASKNNLLDWDTYFYPLDSIENWNRLYGEKGFFQFQCVLPVESSLEGYKKILRSVQEKSSGTFLAVLKKFGKEDDLGNLSFPMEGFTLALDFKVSDTNLKVSKELTEIVNDFGGRIYLAKDALMSSDEFKLQFDESKKQILENYKSKSIESEQSLRIGL